LGSEAQLLVSQPEADVVGLVDVGLGSEQGLVQRLGLAEVVDRIDDGVDA
jgi:hypothetical protein